MRIPLKNAMQLCLAMPSLYRVVELNMLFILLCQCRRVTRTLKRNSYQGDELTI